MNDDQTPWRLQHYEGGVFELLPSRQVRPIYLFVSRIAGVKTTKNKTTTSRPAGRNTQTQPVRRACTVKRETSRTPNERNYTHRTRIRYFQRVCTLAKLKKCGTPNMKV